MSRSSTPLRAIPSNLSGKSAPSVPSPTQAYEPFVKATLRQRLTSKIFLSSALFCWLQASCWSIWALGGFSSLGVGGILTLPFRPLTMLNAVANWMLVALPIVVLRKAYLNPTRTCASSPAKTWGAAWVKTSTRRSLAALCGSSLLSAIIYVIFAYLNEAGSHGDPRLSVFVKSKKHPHFLNGRLLFLAITQLTMAGGFLVRDVMLDRYTFRWNSSQTKFGLVDVAQSILLSSILTTGFMFIATFIFAGFRLTLPIIYQIPVVPIFLRPFTAHFLRGSWTFLLPFYHYKLLFRAWFLGFTTVVTWEFSEALFDTYVSQSIVISSSTADPTVTLVSGVSSSDRVFKFFALSELREFATDTSSIGSSRRTEFFGNQKYSPTLWSQLSREILLVLGQDYQLLLRRGAPPSTTSASVPAPTSPPALPATPAKLIERPIFQSSKKSPLKTVIDSFAADGSFSQVVEAGAEAAHLPEAIKNVEDTLLRPGLERGKGEVKKGLDGAKGIVERTRGLAFGVIRRHAPGWVGTGISKTKEWWTEERLSRAVEGCVPFRELDAVAVEVLSHLVCASLKEDRYGVVQRDTPKILEAMLSFLTAVEEYQQEINTQLQPHSDEQLTPEEAAKREALQMEIDRAGESLSVICNELKEGVGRIVQTFGDKLQAFKFPPHIARKLQGFLDYC
ncbi:hypothetical protein PM082_007643 [Marasmius tenuissimus]|nr:hypothetical protein PM082_007643 [Marasmius tenuissimus]